MKVNKNNLRFHPMQESEVEHIIVVSEKKGKERCLEEVLWHLKIPFWRLYSTGDRSENTELLFSEVHISNNE